MPYQSNPFGHQAYEYKPTWEKDIERSPDKRPSEEGMFIEDKADWVAWGLRSRGVGVTLLRAHLEDGKWVFDGVSIFSNEELQFD